MSQSKYNTYQQASLSQKVSHQIPIFQRLAGSDPATSEAIGAFLMWGKHGLIDLEEPSMKLFMDMLDVKRLALFATSDKNNEITKMGLMMPKSDSVISDFDEDAE